MGVMYLPARVPNEGAHRLAWAIGRAPNPGDAIRQIETTIGVNTVDRLITGSLVPGERMGAAIMLWSGGAVKVADFYRPTSLRWIDEPPPRPGSGWRRPIPGRMIERGSALLARRQGRPSPVRA
jgi:hypothetical protein